MDTPALHKESLDLENTSVLFFDGVCNLCNRTVDFLVRRDKKRLLRYAPLQGPSAASLLHESMIEALPSVVLLENGKAYQRSTAVLRAVSKLGGLWPLAKALLVIPAPIRDVVYDFIGRNRYRWFGKRDSCRLPTQEERELFLP